MPRDHSAAAFTARHQAMRSSREAFASRISRSPWHRCGAPPMTVGLPSAAERLDLLG
jgi:hypothetical protein